MDIGSVLRNFYNGFTSFVIPNDLKGRITTAFFIAAPCFAYAKRASLWQYFTKSNGLTTEKRLEFKAAIEKHKGGIEGLTSVASDLKGIDDPDLWERLILYMGIINIEKAISEVDNAPQHLKIPLLKKLAILARGLDDDDIKTKTNPALAQAMKLEIENCLIQNPKDKVAHFLNLAHEYNHFPDSPSQIEKIKTHIHRLELYKSQKVSKEEASMHLLELSKEGSLLLENEIKSLSSILQVVSRKTVGDDYLNRCKLERNIEKYKDNKEILEKDLEGFQERTGRILEKENDDTLCSLVEKAFEAAKALRANTVTEIEQKICACLDILKIAKQKTSNSNHAQIQQNILKNICVTVKGLSDNYGNLTTEDKNYLLKNWGHINKAVEEMIAFNSVDKTSSIKLKKIHKTEDNEILLSPDKKLDLLKELFHNISRILLTYDGQDIENQIKHYLTYVKQSTDFLSFPRETLAQLFHSRNFRSLNCEKIIELSLLAVSSCKSEAYQYNPYLTIVFDNLDQVTPEKKLAILSETYVHSIKLNDQELEKKCLQKIDEISEIPSEHSIQCLLQLTRIHSGNFHIEGFMPIKTMRKAKIFLNKAIEMANSKAIEMATSKNVPEPRTLIHLLQTLAEMSELIREENKEAINLLQNAFELAKRLPDPKVTDPKSETPKYQIYTDLVKKMYQVSKSNKHNPWYPQVIQALANIEYPDELADKQIQDLYKACESVKKWAEELYLKSLKIKALLKPIHSKIEEKVRILTPTEDQLTISSVEDHVKQVAMLPSEIWNNRVKTINLIDKLPLEEQTSSGVKSNVEKITKMKMDAIPLFSQSDEALRSACITVLKYPKEAQWQAMTLLIPFAASIGAYESVEDIFRKFFNENIENNRERMVLLINSITTEIQKYEKKSASDSTTGLATLYIRHLLENELDPLKRVEYILDFAPYLRSEYRLFDICENSLNEVPVNQEKYKLIEKLGNICLQYGFDFDFDWIQSNMNAYNNSVKTKIAQVSAVSWFALWGLTRYLQRRN